MKIHLPIDTKSLYFNVKNDNASGHTPTVATPLKQGASIHTELAQIIRIPENINPTSRENLIAQILSKSRAEAKIVRTFLFNKISVNGHLMQELPSFCIYIREETARSNVHCGRQKVHYPYSLVYSDLEIDVSNRNVLNAVSEYLNNYAFFIKAFDYSEETAVLDMDATIVGEHDIPYSKVFINRRGVGNKFSSVFSNNAEVYDTEIIALREKLGFDKVYPSNFEEVMAENDVVALNIAKGYLEELGATDIWNLSDEFPFSLYDVEYKLEGRKKFLIVKQTATKQEYFSLPLNQIQFCNDFKDDAAVMLISDVNGEPKIHVYTINQLNAMSKSINSITYRNRG